MARSPDVEGPGNPQGGSLGPREQSNFGFTHQHSGLHGDGRKVKAVNLDTVDPFVVGAEPLYTPVNAATSGRQYRIQIEEVTDLETGQITGVLKVVPV